MIQNINSYEFNEACAILGDTFETSAPIAMVITKKMYNFKSTIKAMTYLVNLVINQEDDDSEEEVHIFDPFIIEQLNEFLTNLPLWLLRYDNIDWTEFLSAYMILFENYIAVQENLIPMIGEEDVNGMSQAVAALAELKELYSATEKLAGMTVGYYTLIKASSLLVDEMRRYEDVAPTTYRLSKLYIDSINEMVKENESC